jgi:hypothetical protein
MKKEPYSNKIARYPTLAHNQATEIQHFPNGPKRGIDVNYGKNLAYNPFLVRLGKKSVLK